MEDIIKAATAKAVLESLDAATREKLLIGAISDVMTTRPEASYGKKGNTKLEDSFNYAVQQHVREVVVDSLKTNTEIKERIAALTSAALTAMLTDDRIVNGIVAVVAQAFEKAQRDS